MKPGIVVFASGTGTNFQALIDACENGELHARIRALITNREDAGAITRARSYKIPYAVFKASEYQFHENYISSLLNKVWQFNPDLIVLAGYLEKIPKDVIEQAGCPIINIHPALLPKYGGKGMYGTHIHRAVIEQGETESGCTVHMVNENFDEGRILKQVRVPVKPDDTPETLAARIRPYEHQILIKTANQLLNPSP